MDTASPTGSLPPSHETFKRYYGFPDELCYQDFLGLDGTTREAIIQRNRVLQTDTYNRTMTHAKGSDWEKDETYVLQLRRAPRGYLIANGIRQMLERLFRLPISKNEVAFAEEFYRNHARVRYFHRDMWDMVLEHNGVPPLSIDTVPDGTALLPGDPVLRVRGPGEIAAHFEPDIHRLFYPTLVATDAHVIARTIGAHRFVEFGKRGTNTEDMHLIALDAMALAGGIAGTSNDAAVAAHPEILRDAGTIGHRFIQHYDTEEASFRRAIASTEMVALLVDLTDSYRGIDLVCRLKEEYRSTGKKIWIRLDSGDLKTQALYALHKFQERGFMDPELDKIVIEDLSSIDDMVEIDVALEGAGFDPRRYIIYGAGSLLTTKDKSRSDASTGFKLSAVGEQPKMKFSDSPGKESLPGQPTIVYQKNSGLLIAQVGEFPDMEDYLLPAFRPQEGMLIESSIGDFRSRLHTTFTRLQNSIGTHTALSPRTMALATALRRQYGLE